MQVAKLFEWAKKYMVAIIIVFIAFAVATPFIINCLYMIGRNLPEPNTAFSASDMIVLYGSILTFIGTTTLGAVAVYQGRKSQKLAENMQQLEQAKFAPIFSVTKVEKRIMTASDLQSDNRRRPNYEIFDMLNLYVNQDAVVAVVMDVNIISFADYPIVSCTIKPTFSKHRELSNSSRAYSRDIHIDSRGSKFFRFIMPLIENNNSPQNWNFDVDFISIFNFKSTGHLAINDFIGPHPLTFKFRLAPYSDVNPKEEDSPNA